MMTMFMMMMMMMMMGPDVYDVQSIMMMMMMFTISMKISIITNCIMTMRFTVLKRTWDKCPNKCPKVKWILIQR